MKHFNRTAIIAIMLATALGCKKMVNEENASISYKNSTVTMDEAIKII